MTIKVTMTDPGGMTPFLVEFSHIKQSFTKKAAIELKNKLQAALDELEEHESMKYDNGVEPCPGCGIRGCNGECMGCGLMG
jgi:hypothetical protein